MNIQLAQLVDCGWFGFEEQQHVGQQQQIKQYIINEIIKKQNITMNTRYGINLGMYSFKWFISLSSKY